ncbi:elongator complex protein 6 [Amia ocellicauda]|uniref:elongator complex protein 6 n=1 Tax=Amia ocellicauda TaxID=2972642 RepID=UPI0034649D26|nr:ELP6 protein [Amia calva]
MFPELNSILNTSPEHCPRGEFVLVSDRQADASFLIHHFLSFYLRAGCKVCFLGLVQSFSHYSAVGQRLGVNLVQARDRGQLVFLEGLKDSLGTLLQEEPGPHANTLDFLSSPRPELRQLFEFVQRSVSPGPGEEGAGPVLIVDDLSVLLSLGLSPSALTDFSHYCRAAVCTELQGSVVVLVRTAEEEEEEEDKGSGLLLAGLSHHSSLELRVQGLNTGHCRDIHGQLELCWRRGSSASGPAERRRVLQYKIQDRGVSFFARGTSSAVL